jgi:hypothetical protein
LKRGITGCYSRYHAEIVGCSVSSRSSIAQFSASICVFSARVPPGRCVLLSIGRDARVGSRCSSQKFATKCAKYVLSGCVAWAGVPLSVSCS